MDVIFRYFSNQQQVESFGQRLPCVRCPHCGRAGHLAGHGRLTGNDPQAAGRPPIIRGQRYYCSNRHRHLGCGRTFSILYGFCIAGYSVATWVIWGWLWAWQASGWSVSLKSAWEQTATIFSLSTAYRLWNQARLIQSAWRTALSQLCPPPPCVQSDPWVQLLAHWRAAFAGHPDPLAAYQTTLQRSIWEAG
jgi:hypothetical protein